VARDLALHDPPRVLAWRLLHEPRLAEAPAWLRPLLPAPTGAIDRDPIALLLAALGVFIALAYAVLAALGMSARARAGLIALAAILLVVLPSVAFVAMGVATDRPYGQDGGVVQLPLALDRILSGESPYGADYSGTILARQARVSRFWEERGGNPILRHHAYLPGTHLVMMPFHLAGRALPPLGDPRVVTLLFYALVLALAFRLPETVEARLAAASLAALNPLVYWHQIFGANDLVFVALLLGTVHAGRRRRPLAAGALLGLACATKQLAWPFAPFLLVALSGARAPRELLVATTWRRLGPPLAIAALVFVVTVLPVAALDFRAFWADIVVYNVGLPGADNYPLGGTPGFGFANYLIYFGHVADLREHFPFSIFYVLLVPLGLLLLRAQLRDGRMETALVTGSAALCLSLYFSRVVHANYLIPMAVLLPVGVLAGRRRPSVALVPLLLLATAVEIAEGAVFRTTWEDAVAASLPRHLGGLAAALAPQAGPGLTDDPLGLLFGATAAGLAVAFLTTAAISRHVRWPRRAIVALAGLLVFVLPLLVLVRVGERTGVVRTQQPWPVQARADAERLLAGRSPYSPPPEASVRGREAFATSFRQDPPLAWSPERPLAPPGSATLGALARAGGVRDPRLLVALVLAALAVLAAGGLGESRHTTAAALVLLPAPVLLGTLFGSPAALCLAALLAAWGARSRTVAAGLLGGVAAGLDHRAGFALLALLPLHRGAQGRRLLSGVAAGYAFVTLPAVMPDPAAFIDRLSRPPLVGPGLGAVNLLAYRGAEGAAAVLAALAPLVLLGAVLALRRTAAPPLAAAGLVWLLALALAPSGAPDDVAAPLLLFGLATLGRSRVNRHIAPGRVASAVT
jgi:hypothetical protein